jgi:hypothetical protein
MARIVVVGVDILGFGFTVVVMNDMSKRVPDRNLNTKHDMRCRCALVKWIHD